MTRSTLDVVVGILLIVFGILMVLGWFGIGALLGYLGIILIVLAILILIGKLPGGMIVGVIALAIGILLVAGLLDLPFLSRDVMKIVNIVLGVVLIVLGIQRLR